MVVGTQDEGEGRRPEEGASGAVVEGWRARWEGVVVHLCQARRVSAVGARWGGERVGQRVGEHYKPGRNCNAEHTRGQEPAAVANERQGACVQRATPPCLNASITAGACSVCSTCSGAGTRANLTRAIPP